MPSRVSIPHGVATGIQIPVVVKQIARVRHEGIRREELAQFRVVVAGVVVLEAGAIAFRGPFWPVKRWSVTPMPP